MRPIGPSRHRHTLPHLILAGCLILLGLVIEVSCIRRPLEVYYRDQAVLRLYMDWTSEFGNRPNGMTVHIYDDNGAIYQAFSTNDVDSTDLNLPVGHYKLIVFNNDLGAYGTFSFLEPERFDGFRSLARTNSRRSTSSEPWDAGTRYTWEPEELLGAAVDSFEVTEDMLQYQLKFLHYTKRGQAVPTRYLFRLDEVAKPLQTMIHIRVHVNGMENMYRMEASLSGMADGCSMAHTWRNPTEGTVYYDSERWSYYFDGDRSKHGWVTIDIPTWGEPRGQELQETRDSLQNTLRMNFTLLNFEQRYWEFNVGHLIEYHDPQKDPQQLTPPDVLRHLYLEINREIPLLPDVPHENETGAGFNAHVDPWEYGGEVDLGTF